MNNAICNPISFTFWISFVVCLSTLLLPDADQELSYKQHNSNKESYYYHEGIKTVKNNRMNHKVNDKLSCIEKNINWTQTNLLFESVTKIYKYNMKTSCPLHKRERTIFSILYPNGTLFIQPISNTLPYQLKLYPETVPRPKQLNTLENAMKIALNNRSWSVNTNLYGHLWINIPPPVQAIGIYDVSHRYIVKVHLYVHRKEKLVQQRRIINEPRLPSVFVFVLEAIDAISFKKYFVRTMSILNALNNNVTWTTGDARSFEFNGFHSSHPGSTKDNLIPMFTGGRFPNYPVWKTNTLNSALTYPEVINGTSNLWLWNWLKEQGYITAFGSTYCNGLFGAHTNEADAFDHHPPNVLSSLQECQLHYPFKTLLRCSLPKPTFHYHWDYFSKFIDTYKDMPKFMYLQLLETHADSSPAYGDMYDRNLPSVLLGYLDKFRKESEPAIILFMGDHGPVEPSGLDLQKFPYLRMIFNRQLLDKLIQRNINISIIQQNYRSLLTHYDLYATIKNIVECTKSKDGCKNTYPSSGPVSKLHTPRSLLFPIPVNRTCEDTGLLNNECICARKKSVSISHNQQMKFVKIILKYINDRSQNKPNNACKELKFRKFTKFNSFLIQNVLNIETVIQVIPGNLRYHSTLEKYTNQSIKLNFIKQATLYEPHTKCTPNGINREFCYCNLTVNYI